MNFNRFITLLESTMEENHKTRLWILITSIVNAIIAALTNFFAN